MRSLFAGPTPGLVVAGLLSLAALSIDAAPRIGARDLALARDYVLAACLIHRYPGTPLAAEAEAWAGGLVEQGGLAADAYPALAQFARTAPEPGTTRDGVSMRLQSCVDFVSARGFSDRLRKLLQR